jgi:translation initiation factor 1 (eIF-1/SUI1)
MDGNGGNMNHPRFLLIDLFIVPQRFVSLLRLDVDTVKAGHATSVERQNMLTAKEMIDIFDQYITRENLCHVHQKHMIMLDGPLTEALFPYKSKQATNQTNPENTITPSKPPEEMSRKELASLWRSKMEPAYAFVRDSHGIKNQIIKIGRRKPPKVLIEVGRVKSRKKKLATRLRGVEAYGIDPQLLAKDISIRLACSATIDETPELNGRPALSKAFQQTCEINIHGNWSNEINALLTSDESCRPMVALKNRPIMYQKMLLKLRYRMASPRKRNSIYIYI